MSKTELREAFIARQRAFLAENPKEGDDKILKAAIVFYDFGVEDAEKAMIDKACSAYCKVCGVGQFLPLPHDCRKDCMMFEDFRKAINRR